MIEDTQPTEAKTEGADNTDSSSSACSKIFEGWDFVILDDNHRPFRVRQFGQELWLHYWHADKKWVTLRPLRMFEGPELKERALPQEQAKLYEAGVPFH